MRKTLQRVPLETGNRWATYALIAWVAFIAGWAGHAMTKPLYCWWAA